MPFSRSSLTHNWLDVREIDFYVGGLEPGFDGYRIAQFSDLHLDGRLTTPARFRELVSIINEQKADLIAFTGDFITRGVSFRLAELIAPLRDLYAPDGKVAIMGNHDHLVNTGLIRRAIRDGGMIDLDNAVYTVWRGDACLHIAGVDSLTRYCARLDLVMAQLPESGTAILLAHEPEFVEVSAATGRFALQLSGHTHGGQIRLPLLTRLALGRFTMRYLAGMYSVGGMSLYVNRGIGGVGPPLRINCRSELTIFTLRSLKQPSRSQKRRA